MNAFERLINVLLTLSVVTALVGQYLVVNKLWSRRAVKEVAESISISAAFLGLATSAPFLVHFALIERDPAPAVARMISIATGIVFVLVGSGLFVRQYRGHGFMALVLGALRLEGKESADLVKALVQPTGAKQLIRIFETMAAVDKHVDPREIKMIEQFARRWRVDPPSLQEGAVEEQGDIVALRESVVAYLEVSPPPEQAEELLDVLHLFVQADVFSAGRFFSPRYAEAVCDKYIALGLFTATVAL